MFRQPILSVSLPLLVSPFSRFRFITSFSRFRFITVLLHHRFLFSFPFSFTSSVSIIVFHYLFLVFASLGFLLSSSFYNTTMYPLCCLYTLPHPPVFFNTTNVWKHMNNSGKSGMRKCGSGLASCPWIYTSMSAK